jgi:HAMP domain-containing protein
MGIRKKIFLGFVIIGLILFTSGMISILQLFRIEKTVADMNVTSIRSIEASGRLFEEAKTQTWKILDIMHENSQGEEARIILNDTLYEGCLDLIRQNISTQEEKSMFDVLHDKYLLFKDHTVMLDSLFLSENTEERNEWFNILYRPVYESFTGAANKMGIFGQNTISKNASELKNNFYRMVIPLIVAIAVGLFLIILFNYFINFYFINPVLKIIDGIKNYSEGKRTYNVKVDTRDEINELNKEVKHLISQTKQKEPAGIFNLTNKFT